ncbi:MAG: FISUMP domain-containing protein [Bacteroidia bacterium]
MKTLLAITISLLAFGISMIGCASEQTEQIASTKVEAKASKADPNFFPVYPSGSTPADSITDPRDGERYATRKIGRDTWLVENMRYAAPGSMLNPDNPSASYGRLYTVIAAQTACPEGWHLPSDAEWDALEIAHGMPDSFVHKGGWRGEHAVHLKSTSGWDKDGSGTDSLGFNVLPAGYFFSEKIAGENAGLEGLGFSAGYWSSMVDSVAYARFMFDVRVFVNKWADERNESEAALSCRCVKD